MRKIVLLIIAGILAFASFPTLANNRPWTTNVTPSWVNCGVDMHSGHTFCSDDTVGEVPTDLCALTKNAVKKLESGVRAYVAKKQKVYMLIASGIRAQTLALTFIAEKFGCNLGISIHGFPVYQK